MGSFLATLMHPSLLEIENVKNKNRFVDVTMICQTVYYVAVHNEPLPRVTGL